MTRETLDYLLRLAIADRDNHARAQIHSGEPRSAAWGQAAAAVRELLELSTGQAATAADIGRKGGAAKVRKGLAMHTTEQRKASAAKAWQTRRAKATAAVPTPAEPGPNF